MPIDIEVLRAAHAAGATADVIMALVEAQCAKIVKGKEAKRERKAVRAAKIETRRAKDRERKRRAKLSSGTPRNSSGTPRNSAEFQRKGADTPANPPSAAGPQSADPLGVVPDQISVSSETKRLDEAGLKKVSIPSKSDAPSDGFSMHHVSEEEIESPRARARELGERVTEVLRGLPAQPDNARVLHDAAETSLRLAGFFVEREFRCKTGYIDLVIGDHKSMLPCVAVELDRRRPRAKSLTKLHEFDGFRIVVTRNSVIYKEFEKMVDAVVAIPIASDRQFSKATRLSPDWRPNLDDLAYARARLPEWRLPIEAERFQNYWVARGDSRAVSTDWSRNWRNWVLKAVEDRQPHGGGNGKAPLHAGSPFHERKDRWAAAVEQLGNRVAATRAPGADKGGDVLGVQVIPYRADASGR